MHLISNFRHVVSTSVNEMKLNWAMVDHKGRLAKDSVQMSKKQWNRFHSYKWSKVSIIDLQKCSVILASFFHDIWEREKSNTSIEYYQINKKRMPYL